ncbi:hypothetical protein Y1Q_0021838 [Alligator mississippiensis]|uniref:Uncharacterized protein n=1 Tax=Alligator mississippiensis TaxID=8496 RepID=A0A151PB66_ALLMI|nr:hypothetical protein Y1Q_0021838 [Alligator mississippiensis]
MTGSQEHLLEDAEYPQLCRYTASNALHWQYGSLKASGLGCRYRKCEHYMDNPYTRAVTSQSGAFPSKLQN